MNIKVKLESKILDNPKEVLVTPEWLLGNDEDTLLTSLVCNGCNYESVMQNGEPSCYGECIDNVFDGGYIITYDEDVLNKHMTNQEINKIIKDCIDRADGNSLKALTDIVVSFKNIG